MDNRVEDQINGSESKTAVQKSKMNYVPVAIVGIVLLAAITVFVVARYIQTKPDSDTQTVAQTEVKSENQPIYACNASSVVSLVPCTDCIAVVEKNQLLYINKDGTVLASSTHDYTDPRTAVYGMELLVYDRGAEAYRIEKNMSVYANYKTDGEILTAAVGKKGNYSVATLDDGGYRSKLFVYDASGKLQFEWGSAHDYISRIALSDNGQYVAVALFGAENAVSYTRLYLFDFTSNEPIFTRDYKNRNCIALDFIHGGELAMVTDCSVIYIDGDEESTWMEYSASSLLGVSIQHAERVSVLTSGADGSVNLNAWNKKGKSVLSVSIAESLDSYVMADGYYCLADSVSGFVFKESGEQTAGFDIPGLITFCIAEKRVFALTEQGIFCYPVHTVTSQTLYITKTDEPQAKSEKVEETAESTYNLSESDGVAVG